MRRVYILLVFVVAQIASSKGDEIDDYEKFITDAFDQLGYPPQLRAKVEKKLEPGTDPVVTVLTFAKAFFGAFLQPSLDQILPQFGNEICNLSDMLDAIKENFLNLQEVFTPALLYELGVIVDEFKAIGSPESISSNFTNFIYDQIDEAIYIFAPVEDIASALNDTITEGNAAGVEPALVNANQVIRQMRKDFQSIVSP